MTGKPRGDLDFGGSTLEAAAAFWASCAPGGRAYTTGRIDLRGALAFVRLMRGLPTLEVRLSDDAAGGRIRAHLQERVVMGALPKHRLAQGVLVVPASIEEYLRGRSRRALRTNMSRAAHTGITVEPLLTAATKRGVLKQYADATPGEWQLEWQSRAAEDGRIWLAAWDCESRLVGLMIATVDVEWAMLEVGIAREQCARWLLHHTLVERLRDSGARYMLTYPRNALSITAGARYLQRLLGYRVFNLSLRRARLRGRNVRDGEVARKAQLTRGA